MASIDPGSCGMGNGNDGAGIIWRLNDDINFALAQLTLKLGEKTNFSFK
jgi:hypothetical protein